VPLLRVLAPRVAQTRALGRFAGWRFAIEEQAPTPQVSLRRKIWDRFSQQGIERPVRIAWFEGLSVDLVLGNDQSRCLYVGGSYEPNEFDFLGRILRPGMTVIDAGANEGFYSLFCARRVGPRGVVVAVEPSPRERARLENNLALNGLRNVRVLRSGLAAGRGRAVLRIANAEHNGQNTLGAFAYDSVTLADEVEIELEPLDAVVRAQALGRVDLLKIDVEGAELAVLQGAEELLARSRPLVLFELLEAALRGQGASAQAVLDFLAARGFDILKFDASGGLSPLRGLAEASTNLVAVPSERMQAVMTAISRESDSGRAAAR